MFLGARQAQGNQQLSDSLNRFSGSRSYWFDTSYPDRFVAGKKSSDSWFRLQAFLNSTDPEKIKALDPTYNVPIQPEDGI